MTTEPIDDDDFEPDAIYPLMLVCRYVLDFQGACTAGKKLIRH
jgi:hypothetical protein